MGGGESGKKMKELYGKPGLISSRCKPCGDYVVVALKATADDFGLAESE